jgi:hypothetical protein
VRVSFLKGGFRHLLNSVYLQQKFTHFFSFDQFQEIQNQIQTYFYFIWIFFIAHYPRVSSKRFTFTYTTLAMTITWVTLESRHPNSGVAQSFPVFIQLGFIFQSFLFFIHKLFTNFLPAFFHLSIWILPLNFNQEFFSPDFDGGVNYRYAIRAKKNHMIWTYTVFYGQCRPPFFKICSLADPTQNDQL